MISFQITALEKSALHWKWTYRKQRNLLMRCLKFPKQRRTPAVVEIARGYANSRVLPAAPGVHRVVETVAVPVAKTVRMDAVEAAEAAQEDVAPDVVIPVEADARHP